MVLLLCLTLAMLAFFHIFSLPKEFLILLLLINGQLLLNFLYLIFNFIDFFALFFVCFGFNFPYFF